MIEDRLILLEEMIEKSTTTDHRLIRLDNNLGEYLAPSTNRFRYVQAPKSTK